MRTNQIQHIAKAFLSMVSIQLESLQQYNKLKGHLDTDQQITIKHGLSNEHKMLSSGNTAVL